MLQNLCLVCNIFCIRVLLDILYIQLVIRLNIIAGYLKFKHNVLIPIHEYPLKFRNIKINAIIYVFMFIGKICQKVGSISAFIQSLASVNIVVYLLT